ALGRGSEHRVDRAVVRVGVRVRVRPDRVPQARPEPPVTGLARVAVLVRVVVLVLMAAHSPSMARKTRCSTSPAATRGRLRTTGNYGHGRPGRIIGSWTRTGRG